MKKSWRKAFPLLVMSIFLFYPGAFATTFTINFTDTNIYWPGWNNNSSDDTMDYIGTPNFIGGSVTVDSGHWLREITVNQNSSAFLYNLISPGDLFINVDSHLNTTWEYFVDLTTWTVAGKTNPDPPAGYYNIFAVSLPLGASDSNPGYILSGQDNSAGWSGYNIRQKHPVAVSGGVTMTDTTKDVYFSAWTNLPAGNPITESFTFVFDPGVISLGDFFTIGWMVNCGNDAIYEEFENPASPEPGTMLLLGSGLIGAATLGRRKLLKKGS